MSGRWLSIVGIGEDGRAGLAPAANALIDGAELIVGGRRHLDLVAAAGARQMTWASPLEATIPEILKFRGRRAVVLASGDPFWFGVGATLVRTIPAAEMVVVASPSSFSLAAARLGWPLQDTETLGLNMKGLTPLIRRFLHDRRRILALSLNADTPREVASIVASCGYGGSSITVLEALGGPRERIRTTTASAFDLDDIVPLNLIALEVAAGPGSKPIAFSSGLPDAYFETDGQLTKREIRAVTLSSLAPGAGELLWDIGAGSGSISIEWMLAQAANRAIAVERDADRAGCIARNAVNLGVPRIEVRTCSARDAIPRLPPPDAIFIGGGANEEGILEACWSALKPGGRLVVNSVTLDTESRLLAAREVYGGDLIRLGVERTAYVGSRLAWRPALPVLHWVARKDTP